MKLGKWVLTVIAATALLITGCKKEGSVDTSGFEKSFASADTSSKSTADSAASSAKSGDYAGALTQLQKLSAAAKLTPEQQQAVKDLMAQLQSKVSDAASQAGKDAQKAVGDVQKSLPK